VSDFKGRKMWTNVPLELRKYIGNDTMIFDFPQKFDRKSLKTNLDYHLQMEQMKKRLDEDKGMIIYFYGFHDWEFMPAVNEINEIFKDYPVLRFNEGMIIFHHQYQDSLQVARKKS
jgi:hypothetical protein